MPSVMELRLEDDTQVQEIQKQFNAYFPFLKLEFFQNPNADTQASVKAQKVKPDRLLRSLTKFYETGRVNMEGTRTVAQLEKDFWESFGLSVQVFRQSGNLWIETTLTDHWTLDKQNHEAEILREKQEKSLDKRIEDDQIDPT